MSNTIGGGSITFNSGIDFFDSDESGTSDCKSENLVTEYLCVCLLSQTTTWVFLPNKHENW